MIKKLILFYFILFFVPLAFAELNNSEINIFAQGVNYVVNLFTFGSQGSLTEGVYESRFITTGLQTGSSHAQGELYLANVGFLGNSSSLEVTPAPTPTPTPTTTPTTAGGGGGGAVIVPECFDDSNCDLGEFCFENKCYLYECETDADCNDTKTCWMNRCVKLFDMKIVDLASPIYPGEFFNFTYYLKGVAQIHGDVKVNFWLEKDGIKVTDGYDTIYMGDFEEKLESSKLFLPISILNGVYNFYAEVNYDSYYARASRVVEVSKEFRRLGDYELLDILFRLETREVSKSEDLVALIDFESFGTIPAKINYNLIISQKNKEVYSEDGKLTVETSETLRKTFDNLVLKKGFYNMQFNVVYGEGVSEDFNTDFEVIKSFSFVDKVKDFIVKYLTWPIIFLLILFIFIKLKRRFKKKQIDELSKETYQFFEVSFFKRFFINLKNIFIPKERRITKKKIILKKKKSFLSYLFEKIKQRRLENKREQEEKELEHHKIEVLEQKKELFAIRKREKLKDEERLSRQKRFNEFKKSFSNFYYNIKKKINSKRLEWKQKQKEDELIKRKWDEIRELQKIQEGRFKEIESKREEKIKEEERLSRQKRFNEFKKYFSNFYSNVKKKINSKLLEWKQKQKEKEFIREQEDERKRLQKIREERLKWIESKREEKIKEEEKLSRQKRFDEFKKYFSNFYSNVKKRINSKRLEWKQKQKENELIREQEDERKRLQKIREERLKEIESKKEEKIKEEEKLSRQKRFNEFKESFSDFYSNVKKKINSKRLEWKQKQKEDELIKKQEDERKIEEKKIKEKLLREKIIEEKKYKEKISEIKRIQDKKIKKSLSNLKDVEKDIDKIKGFDKIKEPLYHFFKKIKQVNLKPKPSQKKIVIEKELILDVNKPLPFFRNIFKKKPSFKIDESNQKSKLFLDEQLEQIPSESSIKNEVSPKNSKSFLDFIKELGNRNKSSFPKKENDSEEIFKSFLNQKFNPKPKKSFLNFFYEKKNTSKEGENYEK